MTLRNRLTGQRRIGQRRIGQRRTGQRRIGAPRRPEVAAARAVALVALAGGALLVAGAAWWALAGAGTGADQRTGLRLEVWDHEHQRAVHTRVVEPGERFMLQHTHSVTGRLVRETFSVTAGGVAMEELWFDEFGPNLPAGPEEINGTRTTFLIENGAFRVLHHGRLLPTVPLRAGSPAVDHVVTFADGTSLRLLDVVRPAAFVEFRVARD